VDTSDTNKTLDSALTVKCTKGTAYTIAMVPSNNDTGGAGIMAGATSGNTDTVGYTLLQGPTGTTPWGNVVATNTIAGIGGAKGSLPASYTVTAKVLATEFDVTPDQYDDLVTVNVAY
jgi:spore coat protein U-like protein